MSAQPLSPPLSQRLKHETEALHLQMHDLMERAQPFSSRAHYAGFLAVQYLFQRDIEYLLDRPGIRQVIHDAAQRGREHAALCDLQDLGMPVPHEPLATLDVTMPEALGWLYVSEGSTLGAAFLLKEAQARLGLSSTFGARNLSAYEGGRAHAWRRFVAALDDDMVPASQHDAIIEGACAAFRRFGELLQSHGQPATMPA
jgi:heme oxygenase (biliverdin-IX-beta and delta-forming)